ncbi:type II toxin-antitoxin system RelE family toxin [Campylobacter ureolyticus]|uniref:type II toxin-antitoxin system RelE family toxin n=1 Tax=Campylobacter ureolyticus TaxID=827 RepID=UPI0022B4E170|nr:type II toxin-antitoxin system RelE/ParE family toxin [Campylobacter ureolyticus]MCZ6112138.1 type II toxin-antitoxin system RelE/ParE family toxin [Campylobacter ureolyticus]MCZ6135657.1 type II toxin-antitoxin system RelE/ParE family toxin [Campylobacter ureolyticus]MCZ6169639.1 type II toxin-antitoxin system RelE/ParE family toxin [Campylobacter ureolyticus]
MKVELNDRAKRDFAKLDKHIQIQIFKKLKFIENLNNPKDDGKPLAGNLLGLWRYRSGDYRILAQILDDKLIILVVKISHRKNVYN